MNYNNLINQNIANIKPSGIRKYFEISSGAQNAISLGIGEPDFMTPEHIRMAGIQSLQEGRTRYTSNAGTIELRNAINDYLTRRFQLSYDPETEILVTVGGSEAIDLALRVLVSPGDEVIVPTPSFVCYGPLAEMAGGVPVYLPLKAEDEFRLTPEALRSVITPRTKVLVLAFPSNPTGAIMEREDLEAIADVLRGTDITILSDEIYAELTYGLHHTSIANIPDMAERTILVNGFSKSYAMTGWRMGYVCGPELVISAMTKLHQFAIMSSPTTSQYAALEAMTNGDHDFIEMRNAYDERRKYLVETLNELGLPCFEPRGAFYLFPDIRSTGMSSDDFCMAFLEEEGVAIIPGCAFGEGGDGFARVCYATKLEDIKIAMERLKSFLSRLPNRNP